MSLLKTKFNNKVNIPTVKPKTKLTYKSPENICDQSIKRFGNNYTKKNKNSKVKKSTYFFETVNFKVINTIRNQLILPQIYDYHCFYRRALGPVLKAAKKNNKEQTKFQLKLARKHCHNRQAKFWHSKYI